jgi:hypothetical protein
MEELQGCSQSIRGVREVACLLTLSQTLQTMPACSVEGDVPHIATRIPRKLRLIMPSCPKRYWWVGGRAAKAT